MACPRSRGRRYWLALLGVPALGWVLIVLLVPTGWVRARLTTRLAALTGRSVQIGSVRLGWFGDLKICNLSLAESTTPTAPWLQVGTAGINVNPCRVLLGCCQPSVVTIDAAEVRVWRRSDGSFEFGDLLQHRPVPNLGDRGSAKPAGPAAPIELSISNSTVHVLDETDQIRLSLSGVNAQAAYQPQAVELTRLEGQLNGGTFRLAGRLFRDPGTPRFSAEVRASKVHLDSGLQLVAQFVPLIARADSEVGGQLNVHLAVHGQGATGPEIRRTLTGHGSLLLDPIDLDGSRILNELRTLGEWPRENRVGAVSSNFTIGSGRVRTDDLTIRTTRVPLVVAGWTDLDGRFDYTTRVDRILAGLPREARSVLGDLKSNFDELAGLRIRGNRTSAELTLNGRPLGTDLGPTNSDRVRFREAARKIRDGIFR